MGQSLAQIPMLSTFICNGLWPARLGCRRLDGVFFALHNGFRKTKWVCLSENSYMDSISRNHGVELGSAGRWPAVFGGPPNALSNQFGLHQTLSNQFGLHQIVWRKMVGRCFRRAAENSTRAACGPHSTAWLRVGAGRKLHFFGRRMGAGE